MSLVVDFMLLQDFILFSIFDVQRYLKKEPKI